MIQIGQRARWFALAVACVVTVSDVVVAQDEPVRPTLDEQGVPQVRFNFKQQSWDQVLDYF